MIGRDVGIEIELICIVSLAVNVSVLNYFQTIL